MTGDKSIRRLNVKLAALTLGGVVGLLVFLVTLLTALVDLESGARYLFLWSVFLPGYEVSVTGALVGALWGLIWGGVAGGLIYLIYDAQWRLRKPGPSDGITSDASPPFVPLDGNAVGLGLGIVSGIALFVATAWLVLRGTAGESIHAELLAWYLPGYSVSISGALMGGLEMVVAVYLLSRIGAMVYNLVLNRRRHSDG
jgi:hypothetical protein